MNEEEIIKALKHVTKMDNISKDTKEVTLGIYYIKAIQGLLDLYDKEKEKNKEYEEGEIFSSKQVKYIEKIIEEKTKIFEKDYVEILDGTLEDLD